jgi:DNA-binding NarL/FixJ family response regulator
VGRRNSKESGVHVTVPSSVAVRWPAFDALPPALKPTAELLSEGMSDEAIATRLQRPLAKVQEDVALVFSRLAVAGRREIARLRTTG